MGGQRFDLIVIGAGPGGYVAAIRAAQLGLSVACIEADKALGGTCLRVGCIPSKALLESSEHFEQTRAHLAEHGVEVGEVGLNLAKMMQRKDRIVRGLTGGVAHLFKQNGVTRLLGMGSFSGRGAEGIEIKVDGADAGTFNAAHVIVATGSQVADLSGVERDGERIGGSTEALAWSSVPEHLVVIGAGVIGLELGSVWRRLGARVTVLEYADGPLPGMDEDLRQEAAKLFAKQGLEMRFGVRVTGARVLEQGCLVQAEGAEPIAADRVLVAVGRRPNTDGLNLAAIGLQSDDRGRIPVDAQLRTSAPGVYAIGDVIAGPMLAHKAEEEGVAAAEHLVSGHGHVDYDAIPAVVYTDPEIAAVGQTEAACQAAGVPVRIGRFPFLANGRARALGKSAGFVKIIAHADTDRVLGVHMIGPRVSELIIEAALAISFSASSEDLARTCHAHPTLHEVVKEAALAVHGRAIHI